MISIKTLSSASAQDVFDHVAKHLMTQKEQSLGRTSLGDVFCLYRNPRGLACAAGCLFADNEYHRKFEGNTWDTLIQRGDVPGDHSSLIYQLQGIHDCVKVNQWRSHLKRLATSFDLKFSPAKYK